MVFVYPFNLLRVVVIQWYSNESILMFHAQRSSLCTRMQKNKTLQCRKKQVANAEARLYITASTVINAY